MQVLRREDLGPLLSVVRSSLTATSDDRVASNFADWSREDLDTNRDTDDSDLEGFELTDGDLAVANLSGEGSLSKWALNEAGSPLALDTRQ